MTNADLPERSSGLPPALAALIDASMPGVVHSLLDDLRVHPPVRPQDVEGLCLGLAEAYSRGEVREAVPSTTAMWLIEESQAPGDKRHGFELLEAMERAGSAAAMYNVAIQKLGGEVTRVDEAGANARCKRVIKHQFADDRLKAMAHVVLGDSARLGRGCSKNHLDALTAYARAGELGDEVGAYNAGLYYHGKIEDSGLPPLYDLAATFYAIAADRGEVRARTNLGALYYGLMFQPVDPAHGARLLRESEAHGDDVATAARRLLDEARARYGDALSHREVVTRSAAWPAAESIGSADLARISIAVLADRGFGPRDVPDLNADTVESWLRRPPSGLLSGAESLRLDAARTGFLLRWLLARRSERVLAERGLGVVLSMAGTPNGRRRAIAQIAHESGC